jgi:hypothetical protein
LWHRDCYRDKNIRGGPPDAQSPLSAATEQGADGFKCISVAVFLGAELIGTITESSYSASSSAAFLLGVFAEQNGAADAIRSYHRNNGRAA